MRSMYVGINKGKVYMVSQKHVKGVIHCTIALWILTIADYVRNKHRYKKHFL